MASVNYSTDYQLSSVVLLTGAGSLDLKDKMVELNYFEDVYSSTISGRLVVSDAVGVINFSSMSGTEFIKITFQKTSDSKVVIDKIFRVYSISNRAVSVNDNFETYTINFCSEEFLLSEQYRISKSYRSKTIKEIINDILTTFLKVTKKVYIGDTIGQYDFILPNKKIFETINWLSLYAQPPKGGSGSVEKGKNDSTGTGADMLFFENGNGYNFKSLQELYSLTPYNTENPYVFNPKNIDLSGTGYDTNQKVYNVISLEILDYFDTLGALHRGTFGNRIITVDPLLRKKYVIDFNYDKYFPKSTKLNKNPVTNNYKNRYGKYLYDPPPNNMEAGVLRLAASNSNQPNYLPYVKQSPGSVAHDIFIENYVPNRVAQIALANYQRIKIIIPGNSEIVAGRVVLFNAYGTSAVMPTGTSGAARQFDPYLSGKYLVSAVRHIMTASPSTYITILELAKESTIGAYAGVNNNDATWNAVGK